jgi:lambda repressor-like predicted transcriptional regulator
MSLFVGAVVTYKTVPEVPGLLLGDDGTAGTFRPLAIYPEVSPSRSRVWVRGRRWSLNLRRMALVAFRGPCPLGMEPVSRDGDPRNFSIENLRWDVARRARHCAPGDAPRGSRNGRARLNEADIAEAKRLSLARWSQERLAARYGVSPSTIQAALSGRTWGHVPHQPDCDAWAAGPRRPLDPAKVAEARSLHAAGGWTIKALANRFGVHRRTMRDALARRTWKHA